MKTISVSELKTHLSRELRKVEKGISLLITDHDHPVAILSSLKSVEEKWIQVADKPMKTFKHKKNFKNLTDPILILSEERHR